MESNLGVNICNDKKKECFHPLPSYVYDKIIQHYNLAKCSIQSYADIVGITWITAASLASTLTLLTRKQL